jgi:hypothetical protein
MFHILNWFAVLSLLALWSLAAWAFHSITAWATANAGVLAQGPGAVEALRMPAWLAPWIPPELSQALTSMVSAFTPTVQAVLDMAPALAGGLSVALWLVWGIGCVLLVVLGVVLSGLIAMLRRRASVHARAAAGPAAGA